MILLGYLGMPRKLGLKRGRRVTLSGEMYMYMGDAVILLGYLGMLQRLGLKRGRRVTLHRR